MGGESQPLDDLAEAVLEGSSVDWDSAESLAGPARRDAVRQLRVLAGIAELHRSLTSDTQAQESVPESPERWGRLEILEHVGRGSFGDVFRARDPKLDREVAVKLLHADRQPEAATVLREARLLARVRHPNVVTVYDADEIDGRVGLWMEFIHGRNLEEVLIERRRFDEREVARIGIELCRAVAAVHQAGLLHRDIKTQNLMQAGDDRLVLMDFGTGRELEAASSAVDAAGTPLYLAPEIFGGSAATVRSDIYSAGVVLFHISTGGYPVRGATFREIREAHARRKPRDPLARLTGMNRALASVIDRAIRPDPSERFETIQEMLAGIEGAERQRQSRRARRSLALGTAAAAVAALAVAVGLIRQNDSRGRNSRGAAAPLGIAAPNKREVPGPPGLFMGIPSPDGRFVTYSDSGNLALYEFATGATHVLTRTSDDAQSRFSTQAIVSADSRRVAYSWNDSSCECVQLRVIGTDGTADRLLYGGRGLPEITPIEWSQDASEILGMREGTSPNTDVVLVSVSDGSVRVVRSLARRPFRVSLSPDGRWVAYDRAEDPEDRDRGIFISSTDGGEDVAAAAGPTYDTHAMWTADGSGFVFASDRTGGPGIWLQGIRNGRVDGRPRLLDKDMGPFEPITLTREGSLFYYHRTGLMDVYTAPIDPASGDVLGEPTNAASSFLGSNLAADWSPDGRTLAFASWRTLFGPGKNILVFHSMGTGLERELHLDVDRVNGPHWSPDGRLIAMGGQLIDAGSGKLLSRFVPPQTGDIPVYGSFDWSPDGLHAYLRRNDPQRITKVNTSSGEEEIVYAPPLDSVLGKLSVSPDGRWLAFSLFARGAKGFRLMVVPTNGGSARVLLERPENVSPGSWTRDGKRILFVLTTGQPHVGELWAAPFDGGPARRLGLRMRSLRDVRVSPDGTRIAFTSGYPDRDLWVFENFLPHEMKGRP